MNIIPKKSESPMCYQLIGAWVVLLVLILAGNGIITFISVDRVRDQISAVPDTQMVLSESGSRHSAFMPEVYTSLDRIKRQLAISLVLVIILAGAGFYLVNRQIAVPMKQIISGLTSIRDGNFDTTLSSGGCREIDQIESLANDISANFQEVLLLLWTHSDQSAASCLRLTESLRQLPDNDLGVLTEIASIHQHIREMRNLIDEFEFFDVSLNENKVLAG